MYSVLHLGHDHMHSNRNSILPTGLLAKYLLLWQDLYIVFCLIVRRLCNVSFDSESVSHMLDPIFAAILQGQRSVRRDAAHRVGNLLEDRFSKSLGCCKWYRAVICAIQTFHRPFLLQSKAVVFQRSNQLFYHWSLCWSLRKSQE